jgi:hypothetical protein
VREKNYSLKISRKSSEHCHFWENFRENYITLSVFAKIIQMLAKKNFRENKYFDANLLKSHVTKIISQKWLLTILSCTCSEILEKPTFVNIRQNFHHFLIFREDANMILAKWCTRKLLPDEGRLPDGLGAGSQKTVEDALAG